MEGTEKGFIDTHHSTSVIKFSTVITVSSALWSISHAEHAVDRGGMLNIRSREQSDQLSFREELVTILDDLMRTTNQVHVVFL